MEPTEFDSFIKHKLGEPNTLHNQDVMEAKPRVWNAVFEQKHERNSWIKWITVAAIFICILLLPIHYFKQLQTSYVKKLENIELKFIAALQQQNLQQNLLESNEKNELCSEIDLLQQELIVLKEKPVAIVPQPKIKTRIVEELVYIRDTIYLPSKETFKEGLQFAENRNEPSEQSNKTQVNSIIFPDYQPVQSVKKQPQSSIKVVINPFNN